MVRFDTSLAGSLVPECLKPTFGMLTNAEIRQSADKVRSLNFWMDLTASIGIALIPVGTATLMKGTPLLDNLILIGLVPLSCICGVADRMILGNRNRLPTLLRSDILASVTIFATSIITGFYAPEVVGDALRLMVPVFGIAYCALRAKREMEISAIKARNGGIEPVTVAMANFNLI